MVVDGDKKWHNVIHITVEMGGYLICKKEAISPVLVIQKSGLRERTY